MAVLASVSISCAEERPMLNSPAGDFVAFYGEPKSTDTVLGMTRLWRKGPFLITHIEGKGGVKTIGISKIEGSETLNRREAFMLADRFCGKQEWVTRDDHDDMEVYVNANRTYQMAFNSKSTGGMNGHVTITYYPLTKGIEDL